MSTIADRAKGAAFPTLDDAFAGITAADVDRAAAVAAAILGNDAWIAALLRPAIDGLTSDPWVQPPMRVARDRARIGVQVYDGVAGVLTATVLDGAVSAAAPRPTTLICSGRLVVTRYHRAAGWRLDSWRRDERTDRLIAVAPLDLADGAIVRHDGRSGAHLLVPCDAAPADVVTVTFATRAPTNPREYDRTSGQLLRLAAASEADSRTRMLLTLLRVSGRDDAVRCFDAATRAGAFDVRWEAMREWLALDAAGAAPRLAQMAAQDTHAEVRAAARATLPLVEAHLCRA